jgi:hypothetical protein
MAFQPPFLTKTTAAEFSAALKVHGFRVVNAKIEDATGRCPGISWTAVLRGRIVDHARTLAKVIRERQVRPAVSVVIRYLVRRGAQCRINSNRPFLGRAGG